MTSDSRGNLLTLIDAKGNESHFEYDANGNMIRAINALGQVTAYEYDGEGRLVRLTDAKGNSSSLSYDAKGRMVALTDPLGNTRTLAYDKTRNLVAVQDAYNRVIQSLSYDSRDNLLGITDALGNSSGLEYDELNRLKQSTDPLGRVVQMNYDALDRLSSTVDPLGGIAAQSFDADGRLIDITDPKGNRTSFAYDSNGRRISETSATGSTVKYTYTARDLLAKLTNARGQERQFTYDALGRLIAMSDPDGTVSYSYDVNSNVLTVSNADGTISREYDALDRVIKYTDSRGNVIRYEYDAVGNLSSLTYPDGKQVQYGYDAADRLVSVTDWNNRTTSYAYDKEGRLVLTTRPNGSTVARVYNEAGQLLQQKDAKAGGEVIVQYDYTYDKVGNIVEEKPTPAPEPMAISPAVMTYGPANLLATYNGLPVQHDADGNMVQGPLNRKAVSFVFDSRNRLRQVGSTVYTYNAENQRIAVTEGGAATRYAINPNTPLSQVLIREDQAGKKTYYVYGIGLIGQEKNGAYRSFHYDFRGSTVAMTDEVGKITHRYAYTAYGTVKAVQEEAFNPFRYVGQYGVMYEGNGLYYMRARYYQPELRRFLGEDPIWNKNLFAYVEGNPLVGIDPNGLQAAEAAFGAWGVSSLSGAEILALSSRAFWPTAAIGIFYQAAKMEEEDLKYKAIRQERYREFVVEETRREYIEFYGGEKAFSPSQELAEIEYSYLQAKKKRSKATHRKNDYPSTYLSYVSSGGKPPQKDDDPLEWAKKVLEKVHTKVRKIGKGQGELSKLKKFCQDYKKTKY